MSDEKKDTNKLVIGTGGRILVEVGPDGSLTYGPDYKPDEAAKAFWEAMASRRADYEARLLFFAQVEQLMQRIGEQDLLTERLRMKAAEEQALPVDRFSAERAIGQLEVLVHEMIELARGVALRDRHNRTQDAVQEVTAEPRKTFLN